MCFGIGVVVLLVATAFAGWLDYKALSAYVRGMKS